MEQGAALCLKSLKPQLNGAVFADVDLDNIVCGKRARTTTKQPLESNELKSKQLNSEKSGQSSVRNARKRPPESTQAQDDFVAEEQVSGKTKKLLTGNIRANQMKTESLHTFVNNEQHPQQHPHSSLSISPRTTKSCISMPQQELVKLLGPLPEAGSQIFESISFLLTCGDRGNKSEEMCTKELNPERSTPFDKSYLTKQIESGGGHVFQTFEEAKVRIIFIFKPFSK